MILPKAREGRRGLSLPALLQPLAGRVRLDSLLRNSVYIMGTTMATSLLGFLYWWVAARTYTKADIGLASALIAAMTLASNLSNLGIGPTLVQRLPRRAAGREWSVTLNAGLLTGLLCGLLAGIIVVAGLPRLSAQFAIIGHKPIYAAIFVLGVPLWTLSTLLDYVFVAQRATGNMLARNIAFSLLKIPLLALALLIARIGALGILASWVLAAAAAVLGGLLLLVPRLGRGYSFALRGFAGQLRAMLSALAGNHFINIGGMAPMYLLPIFVTARLSATQNAYFYITWMLGSLFFMVSPAVASSLFAEGSHVAEGLWRKARASTLIIGALLAPAMAVFLVGGRYILGAFGAGYPQHGRLLLTLLIISAVPDAITNVYVSVLRVRRRLGDAALLNLGMAALTLAMAWLLLPLVGIAGAGWAWLAAQSVGSVAVAAHIVFVLRRQPVPATAAVVASAHGAPIGAETIPQAFVSAEAGVGRVGDETTARALADGEAMAPTRLDGEMGTMAHVSNDERHGASEGTSSAPLDPVRHGAQGMATGRSTRRITLRNLFGLLRYALLRLRFRNLRVGLFFADRGADVWVGPMARVSFGRGVRFMRDFSGHFYGEVTIGDNVFFNRGCNIVIHEALSIGDNCLFGEMVSIHDENHVAGRGPEPLSSRGFTTAPVRIGSNVWVGAKVTIVPGVTIGDNAVIGANAVVTRDVPPYCVAVGIPARVVREL